jgi:hypothetical protein
MSKIIKNSFKNQNKSKQIQNEQNNPQCSAVFTISIGSRPKKLKSLLTF